jgi:hypothetical protein
MTTVNLQELNNFIHNMYGDVGLNENVSIDIAQWLTDNLGDTGRYGYRDYERFGNRTSQEGDDDHFDRQDGWVSLTEEVPNIQHLTYGTGILYIHGEMEIPDYENSPKDHIFGDEFYHVDKSGGTKHIYDDVINPERYISWNRSTSDLKKTYDDDLRLEEYGSLLQDDPDHISLPPIPGVPQLPTPQVPTGPERGDAGARFGYVWEFKEEDHKGTIGDGRWLYETITDAVGGEFLEEMIAETPKTNKADPPVHNDDEIYNLDNERNHFPWLVVNSGRTESIKSFLKEWEGDKGMYDEEFPELAQPSWPPKKHGGIKFVKKGIDGILDFMSPIEETP